MITIGKGVRSQGETRFFAGGGVEIGPFWFYMRTKPHEKLKVGKLTIKVVHSRNNSYVKQDLPLPYPTDYHYITNKTT